MMTITRMTRRQFFEKLGKGSLVVGFSLSPVAASILAEEAHAASVDSQLTVLSGFSSGSPPQNDAWLTIDHQGKITLFSGKVEIVKVAEDPWTLASSFTSAPKFWTSFAASGSSQFLPRSTTS